MSGMPAIYWPGVVKGITAGASLVTAVVLISLAPRVMSLPGRMHLQEENRKLADEVADGKWLEEVRGHLAAVVESSDDAIISKTLDGTITSWNPGRQEIIWLLVIRGDRQIDAHALAAGAGE